MASRIMDQKTPPPPHEQLSKLQLMRTALVNFIDWKNFPDVVTGCYVRVLLEMRSEGQRENMADNYYVACVKGARKGPSYGGFSCDGATTEWHILIELPPCFRMTANGNVVQLNSISNTAFRAQEYQSWVSMCRESGTAFPSLPQLEFRCKLLEEHKMQAMTPAIRKRRNGEDPQIQEQREQRQAALREEVTQEVQHTHAFWPKVERLRTLELNELQDVERKCLDLIGDIRKALNDKSMCLLCRQCVSTVICYPCKHQVVCKKCIDAVSDKCPAPNCNIPITQKFEAFTS